MNTFLFILIALAGGGLILFLFKMWGLVNQSLPQEKLEKLNRLDAVAQQMGDLHRLVTDLQSQLGRDSSFRQQLEKVLEDAAEASKGLLALRTERQKDLETFTERFKKVEGQLGGMLTVLTGRRSGEVGENILREAFRQLPQEWLRTPYYDVEFGIVLFDRRVLPVDSKFAATDLLQQLEQIPDGQQRDPIFREIERQVLNRAKEVAKYIDPATTTPFAICAIPDSIFNILRRAHVQSYQEHKVLILSYSMAIPYVLSQYDSSLKHVGQLDEEQVDEFVRSVEQSIKILQDNLENRVKEADTRLVNAYRECIQAVSSMEGALAVLRRSRLGVVMEKEVN